MVDLCSLVRPGQAGFIEPHLHVTLLAAESGVGLLRFDCSSPRCGFEARELTPQGMLVIVQRGAFTRRTSAGRTLADPGFGYFGALDGEEEVAHPEPGGDRCTSLTIEPAVLAAITAGDLTMPMRPVAVDSRAYRRLRSLVVEARTQKADDWLEQALDFFTDLYRDARERSVAVRRPRTIVSHQAMIDETREALVADPGLSVVELARLVGHAPNYLSRTFRRVTGTSISAYRLRLRTRAAVARIEAGEANLARLAIELGFADHSHMCRAVRRETSTTPSSIRLASRGTAP